MADEITLAKTVRLRKTFVHLDALSDELKARIVLLDDDEIAVLESIKSKLDAGLDQRLKAAANTVGVIVW